MSLRLIVLLTAACLISLDSQAADSFPIDLSSHPEPNNDVEWTLEGDVISITTTGRDPYFSFEIPATSTDVNVPAAAQEPERDWMFSCEYSCASGVKRLEWRSGLPFSKSRVVEIPNLPPAEGWTTYTLNLSEASVESIRPTQAVAVRIDLGRRPGVKLQVRNAMVRRMTERESVAKQNAERIRTEKQHLADQIRHYIERDWPTRIKRLEVSSGLLQMKLRLSAQASGNRIFAVPRDTHSIASSMPSDSEWPQRVPIQVDLLAESDPPKSLTVDRSFPLTHHVDLGSRWQLVAAKSSSPDQPSELLSSARYVDVVVDDSLGRPELLPPKRLKAAKGLTCITSRFSSRQLQELGLEHGSINILLSDLVRAEPFRNGRATQVDGRTWYVNESKLKQYDRDVLTARDAGIQLAGILLVPFRSSQAFGLAHPESDSAGTYAMPNLTTAESTLLYHTTLRVLSERYSGADPSHGRIDHWIVHNEVDYGWQWTNMGEQPEEIFVDHYVRSMRMIDAAARQSNPHSRVFISLTHRWNSKDNLPWKTYAPKQLMDDLIKLSKQEGDFPWGVAYHPYPQSLWQADTWNDTQPTDDLETPLITVKNLQVLDRFMHLPESRMADGSVRPVLCSEQGFHADETNTKQLETQARALLYTWQKLRQCPSILAFDYHRPSDHPREGGLRLGLRGLPSQENRLGRPKPAWDVYQAIGTDREAIYQQRYMKELTSDR